MKTTFVESSTLRTVAYDEQRKMLQLEFQSGAVYQYFRVPFSIYEELLQAPSKGSYFNRVIRDQFFWASVKAASAS